MLLPEGRNVGSWQALTPSRGRTLDAQPLERCTPNSGWPSACIICLSLCGKEERGGPKSALRKLALSMVLPIGLWRCIVPGYGEIGGAGG